MMLLVIAGTKKQMKSHLEEEGSLIGLAYEAIRRSENILANELLDLALDDEQDIVVNGDLIKAKQARKLICRPE
jgi:hypothetical protein